MMVNIGIPLEIFVTHQLQLAADQAEMSTGIHNYQTGITTFHHGQMHHVILIQDMSIQSSYQWHQELENETIPIDLRHKRV
jgi:hypothetical protein